MNYGQHQIPEEALYGVHGMKMSALKALIAAGLKGLLTPALRDAIGAANSAALQVMHLRGLGFRIATSTKEYRDYRGEMVLCAIYRLKEIPHKSLLTPEELEQDILEEQLEMERLEANRQLRRLRKEAREAKKKEAAKKEAVQQSFDSRTLEIPLYWRSINMPFQLLNIGL